MNKHILKAALYFCILVLPLKVFSSVPEIYNGVLDLSQWDGRDIISLDGKWSFFPSSLIDPDDFAENTIEHPVYVDVPAYWTEYEFSGENLPGQGYASYGLRIVLPSDYKGSLGFRIPVFDDSYRFFINGKEYASNGIVSEDPEIAEPGYMPQSVFIEPDTSILSVIFHVSNYEHRRGGFWKSVKMGSKELLVKNESVYNALIYTVIGMTFTFFLFFLFFFLFYRKNLTSLFFSFSLFGMLIRFLVTGNFPIYTILNVPWDMLIKLEYLGTYIAFTFGTWFFLKLYKLSWLEKLTKLNSVVMGLFILLVIVADPGIFSYSILYFKPAIILFFTLILGLSLYYSLTRKGSDIIIFIALLVFMGSLVNDMLVSGSGHLLSDRYILEFGAVFFVFVHAILLIRSWIYSYKDKLNLNTKVEFMNLELEKLMQSRIEEIKNSKNTIREKNAEIIRKKKELKELGLFNQKVQAIIGHDLYSPVTSLFQVSDYLYQSNKKAGQKETLHSIRELSETAANLVENLLFWTRGKKGEIDVRYEKINLLTVVNELIEFNKVNLERKNIKIDTLMKEDLWVESDVRLVRIVLRNIVYNAIKYTPKGGRISITAARPEESPYSVLIVEDPGVGIPEEVLKQLNDSDAMDEIKVTHGTLNEKGSGLGIKLCHELLDLIHGKLKIDSEKAKGTRVMIFIRTTSPQ